MDKVLLAIWQLLIATQKSTSSSIAAAKSIWRGDKNQIAESDCPAIIVRPVSSSWTKGQSRYDQKQHLVEVVIVANFRQYAQTKPEDPYLVPALIDMMKMMEETDTAQKTVGDSIVGVLRANTILPYTDDTGTARYASVDLTPESVDYVFNTSRGFPTFEIIAAFRVTSQGDRA